ncbi:MAG: hypothetical protein ACRD5I_09165 [Candidatus Acidiferrales bacterium]
MGESEAEIAGWARLHKVCYEVAPLIEMDRDQKVQVGYMLDFYAHLPVDKPPGPERREAAVRIWERLRDIVQSFAPSSESQFRLKIAAPRFAVYQRPQSRMEPEIMLSAQVFHADKYFTPVTDDERAKLSLFERKLTSLGIKRGHW